MHRLLVRSQCVGAAWALSVLGLSGCFEVPDARRSSCSSDSSCSAGDFCYRGFCVGDSEQTSDADHSREADTRGQAEATRASEGDDGIKTGSDASDAVPDAGPSARPDAVPSTIDSADAGSRAGDQTTARDTGLSCLPGTYSGSFDGEIAALAGLLSADITGSITIQLALAGNGNQLEIKGGTLTGEDLGGGTIAADISGRLNCATKTFQDVRLTEGKYTGIDPLLGGPLVPVDFTGVVTATYFDDPPSAQGTWQVQDALGLPAGSGRWTAQRVD